MSDSVHVLIAEDQGLIASLIEISLLDEGLTSTVVGSGAEALAALDSETRFQVLVTDIRMGAGPDGWAVATLARERHPEIRVVYITGDSMDDWRVKGVAGSLLVSKPFLPEELIGAVAGLLSGPPTETF